MTAGTNRACRPPSAGVRWLEQWGRDFLFSIRSLRRAPGLSLAVIATLTLCIGANATIFTALYGLILKPLPYRDPGQLVEIYNSMPKAGQPKRQISVTQYVDFKAHADLFEGVALWQDWSFNIGEETDPTRGIGARVTADYFSVLGVQPLLGRFFTMEESTPGRDNVLVLTQSFWESNYGADPGIVGKVIHLGGTPYTIVGVAPRRLEACNVDGPVLKPFEWVPQQGSPQARLAWRPMMYARVKKGVDPSAALAQLATLEKRYYREVAQPIIRDYLDRGGYRIALGQVRAEQTKSVKDALMLLQGGALPMIYLPFSSYGGFSMEIRTNRSLADLLPLMRARMRSIDPALPLYQVMTLETLYDSYLDNRKGVMFLLGGFAFIALLLAAVGIYGMLAYDVSQRTREIGIRGAIGASRAQITGLILRQGLTKAGIGIALGLVGALFLTRFMTGLLYDVRPTDPAAYALVSLVLLAVASLASYLPARRAARVDPVVALRVD
jgi:hypothetical protein